MLTFLKVAITGDIASGKSTVCDFYRDKGAYCLSADRIVHQLLSDKSSLKKIILELLGDEVLVNGELSRQKIADKVFSNSQLLKQYESIIHPEVRNEIRQEFLRFCESASSDRIFIVEVPLLYEAKMEKDFQRVIYVTAPSQLRQARFKGAPSDFKRRESRLSKRNKLCIHTDYTIENTGTLEELHNKSSIIWDKLTH